MVAITQGLTENHEAQPWAARGESVDRGQLDAQLASAQTDAATALALLLKSGAEGSRIAEAQSQLGSLAALKRQIETAGPRELPALQAELSACLAASAALAREAGVQSESGSQALERQEAREASHRFVREFQEAYFEKRIFDPYLKFASTADEEEFRKREDERRRYIEEQQAKGTPQGDYNAALAARDQIRDAGAHGATASPDYERLAQAADKNVARLQRSFDLPGQTSKAEGAARDPFADLVDGADVAKFEQSGVRLADQKAQGHGVSFSVQSQRTPTIPG